MTDPGKRPHLCIIQRAGPEVDDGYTTQRGPWTEYARGYAAVLYGTAMERREAAQEAATQAATFVFDWTPKLARVLPSDRLVIFETIWGIASAVVVGMQREVHITAIADLDSAVDAYES